MRWLSPFVITGLSKLYSASH